MARPLGSTNSRKFKRRPPSAAEQARRTAVISEVARRVVEAANQWKREQGVI
jgi:hypothetical protein